VPREHREGQATAQEGPLPLLHTKRPPIDGRADGLDVRGHGKAGAAGEDEGKRA